MVNTDKNVYSDNLDRLRTLVDELENQDNVGEDYHQTLKNIEKVIKDEKYIINSLNTPENKIKHYEAICTSILYLLSTIKA